jgi:release factor glutamine methyltransferase
MPACIRKAITRLRWKSNEAKSAAGFNKAYTDGHGSEASMVSRSDNHTTTGPTVPPERITPEAPFTIGEILARTAQLLTPIAGELAAREAQSIVEHVLEVGFSDLYLHPHRSIADDDFRAIQSYVEQRLTGMPLAYVLRQVYFYDQEFKVSPAVLIPRPDTEILLETILRFEIDPACNCIEVGTGSGIISQILSKHRDSWNIIAIDISPAACSLTKTNCPHLATIACMDRLTALRPNAAFDFIVSNPPYISAKELQTLDESVIRWEPRNALDGGIDGLDFYRYFAQQAGYYLKPGGRLYGEIGWQQVESLSALFRLPQWQPPLFLQDLAGRPRVVRTLYQPHDAKLRSGRGQESHR